MSSLIIRSDSRIKQTITLKSGEQAKKIFLNFEKGTFVIKTDQGSKYSIPITSLQTVGHDEPLDVSELVANLKISEKKAEFTEKDILRIISHGLTLQWVSLENIKKDAEKILQMEKPYFKNYEVKQRLCLSDDDYLSAVLRYIVFKGLTVSYQKNDVWTDFRGKDISKLADSPFFTRELLLFVDDKVKILKNNAPSSLEVKLAWDGIVKTIAIQAYLAYSKSGDKNCAFECQGKISGWENDGWPTYVFNMLDDLARHGIISHLHKTQCDSLTRRPNSYRFTFLGASLPTEPGELDSVPTIDPYEKGEFTEQDIIDIINLGLTSKYTNLEEIRKDAEKLLDASGGTRFLNESAKKNKVISHDDSDYLNAVLHFMLLEEMVLSFQSNRQVTIFDQTTPTLKHASGFYPTITKKLLLLIYAKVKKLSTPETCEEQFHKIWEEKIVLQMLFDIFDVYCQNGNQACPVNCDVDLDIIKEEYRSKVISIFKDFEVQKILTNLREVPSKKPGRAPSLCFIFIG